MPERAEPLLHQAPVSLLHSDEGRELRREPVLEPVPGTDGHDHPTDEECWESGSRGTNLKVPLRQSLTPPFRFPHLRRTHPTRTLGFIRLLVGDLHLPTHS